MLFSGRKLTAQEACAKGLVSQVFWPGTFTQEVMVRIKELVTCNSVVSLICFLACYREINHFTPHSRNRFQDKCKSLVIGVPSFDVVSLSNTSPFLNDIGVLQSHIPQSTLELRISSNNLPEPRKVKKLEVLCEMLWRAQYLSSRHIIRSKFHCDVACT